MATVILYRIPHLQANKKQTLDFVSSDDRDAWFDAVTNKLTISTSDSTIGYLEDNNKLYTEITVTTNGTQPYSLYNYVQIQNNSSFKRFYFILDYKEIGRNQVKYFLKMDTMVTFVTTPNMGYYLGGGKSLVMREHKPRFSGSTPIYDKFIENINITPKILQTETFLGNKRFRGVYRNRANDWKPVVYIYAESAQSVSYTGTDWVGSLTPGSAANGIPFYVWDGDYYYTLGPGTPNILQTDDWYTYFHALSLTTGGTWQVTRFVKSTGNVHSVVLNIPAGLGFKLKVGTVPTNRLYYATMTSPTPWTTIHSLYTTLNNAASGTASLPLWSDIDIYDAQNEKIVEFPYLDLTAPFKKDGYGIYVELNTYMKFSQTISFSLPSYYSLPSNNFVTSGGDVARIPFNDPKIFTSQFSPRFIQSYTGSFLYKRESMGNLEFELGYSMFESSRFNLKYKGDGLFDNINEQYVSFDVNNQIATVKDDAYTYNQYYRDIEERTMAIQRAQNERNALTGSIQQGLGIVGGALSAGKLNPIQLGFRAGAALVNIASTYADLADNQEVTNLNYKQKLIQLQLSQSQIAGGSLEFVRGLDKLKMYVYGPTGAEAKYLDDIFYLTGYNTLEYKIPTLRTRKHFDYKQLIPNEVETTASITEEIKEDIAQRFIEGITIFHPQADKSVDWYQTKENWEL